MPRTASEELPRIIAAAARRLVEISGPRGVTHRSVAAEAGVAVDSVANRFGSIDALVDHVALRGFSEIVEAMLDRCGKPLQEVGDAAGVLAEAETRYRRWALDNPGLYRLMFTTPMIGIDPSPATRRAAADLLQAFVAMARAAREEDPQAAGQEVLAKLHGRVHLALAFSPPLLEP
ncbi:MAG: TetR/AcrR family transcriptional regulator [Acidimicrobiales bacterium]